MLMARKTQDDVEGAAPEEIAMELWTVKLESKVIVQAASDENRIGLCHSVHD